MKGKDKKDFDFSEHQSIMTSLIVCTRSSIKKGVSQVVSPANSTNWTLDHQSHTNISKSNTFKETSPQFCFFPPEYKSEYSSVLGSAAADKLPQARS